MQWRCEQFFLKRNYFLSISQKEVRIYSWMWFLLFWMSSLALTLRQGWCHFYTPTCYGYKHSSYEYIHLSFCPVKKHSAVERKWWTSHQGYNREGYLEKNGCDFCGEKRLLSFSVIFWHWEQSATKFHYVREKTGMSSTVQPQCKSSGESVWKTSCLKQYFRVWNGACSHCMSIFSRKPFIWHTFGESNLHWFPERNQMLCKSDLDFSTAWYESPRCKLCELC